MCYLPLPCLNFVVGVGAFVSILVALGLLALTVYANLEKKEIIDNTAGKIISDYLVGLYLASTVFMVLGICGLYSTFKNNKKTKGCGKCWLTLYGIGVFVFFLIFISGTVFFFVGPETIFRDDCTSGSQVQLIDQLYALNLNATKTFCQVGCECYVNQKAQGAVQFLDFAAQHNLVLTKTDFSKINYQSCLPEDQRLAPNIELMKSLQNIFECSGWCQSDPIKINRFSDINNCLSKQCLNKRQACYDKFQSFLKQQGRLVGFGCAIATTLCLLNLIAICCIQCHPKRTKRGNFYDKMMDDD